MFRREWLQSSRISVLELAYISVGKDPDLAQSMESRSYGGTKSSKMPLLMVL